MASVTKKSGKWYAIYKDASGKQKWIKGYSDKTETERLARKLEDEARAVRLGDVDLQVEARRIERAKAVEVQLADYKASLQAAGCTAGHVAYTIGDVEKFIEYTKVKSASEITKPMVDRWALSLKSSDANKTINRRVGSLQQFLKALAETGGVTEYVLYKYPKLETDGIHRKRESRALGQAEAEKLITKTPDDNRKALYLFALKTGFRMNECRQIVPAFIDFKHATVHLPAHIDKARKDRTLPLSKKLIPMLRRRCKGLAADAPIFRMPTKQHVIAQLKADCETVKISSKDVGFHALRHTFCTLLARNNVHPKVLHELARHSDYKMTLKYYTHFQRDDERAALNGL